MSRSGRTRSGQHLGAATACVLVKEEEERRHGCGYGNMAEALGAEGGPAGNAEQLRRRKRGLDPLGQPQNLTGGLKANGA